MPELLNLVGLSTGVVLYAMLLAMVLRASGAARSDPRFDPLLVVTSILGLVWNLCALAVYEFPKVGIDGPFPVLAAVGFSALGFLPAVSCIPSSEATARDCAGGGTSLSLPSRTQSPSSRRCFTSTR